VCGLCVVCRAKLHGSYEAIGEAVRLVATSGPAQLTSQAASLARTNSTLPACLAVCFGV
jgi:hypothetical protein